MPKRSKKELPPATTELMTAEKYQLYMKRVFAALAQATKFYWPTRFFWDDGYVTIEAPDDYQCTVHLDGSEEWELNVLEGYLREETARRAELAIKEVRKQAVLDKLTSEEREALGFK